MQDSELKRGFTTKKLLSLCCGTNSLYLWSCYTYLSKKTGCKPEIIWLFSLLKGVFQKKHILLFFTTEATKHCGVYISSASLHLIAERDWRKYFTGNSVNTAVRVDPSLQGSKCRTPPVRFAHCQSPSKCSGCPNTAHLILAERRKTGQATPQSLAYSNSMLLPLH